MFQFQAVLSQELMLSVRPKLFQCAKDNGVTDEELAAIIANDLSHVNRNAQVIFFFILVF